MPSVESSERWHERQADNVAEIHCDRDNPLIRVGRPRDILDILREGSDRQTYPNWHGICKAAADEIERLRKERDEARRDVCTLVASARDRQQFTPVNGLGSAAMAAFRKPIDPESVARERGWDCFEVKR